MKKAFITGITGQDGAWLSKLLLDKGYEVFGGVRRVSRPEHKNLRFVGTLDKVNLIEFDLVDQNRINQVVKDYQFDEFYNLAANSFVASSFQTPVPVLQMDGVAVLYMLEAIRIFSPHTRFYQASTSEMFGKVQEIPQKETTPFYPRSPYGVAKLQAHWSVVNHRESYNLFASSGILFNHESELRGPEFVTRKITMHAATWANNKTGKVLEIGNMDAKRDWGYAKEYVEGMWLMLQHNVPDTFVLATGVTETVRNFISLSFKHIGREIEFEGKNENEIGRDIKTGDILVKVNPAFYRPAEVDILIGDPSKAKKILKWEAKTNLEKLSQIMVENDILLLN